MKQNFRTFFLCSFLLLTVYISFAQQKSITGTVTSKADGIPIPGVNVIIQGTSNGTQTDFDGNYKLTANVGDVLVYSYIGMTSVQMTTRKIGIRIDIFLVIGEIFSQGLLALVWLVWQQSHHHEPLPRYVPSQF